MQRKELDYVINLHDQEQSMDSAAEATDQAESDGPDTTAIGVTCLDESGHWTLEIRGTVLTASGGAYSAPAFTPLARRNVCEQWPGNMSVLCRRW
jgi:hypothetical protein